MFDGEDWLASGIGLRGDINRRSIDGADVFLELEGSVLIGRYTWS